MSDIPPAIITELLYRLPVKSLLRFRSVSKSWCAEIDSLYFIKFHLAKSISTSSNLSVLAESNGTLYSIYSNSLEKVTKIETSFTHSYQTMLYNSCNGLILLQLYEPRRYKGFILYNPSTRKHFELPTPPPHTKPHDHVDVVCVPGSNCLGYDGLNDDYKVFIIDLLLKRERGFSACRARVYSLKSNSWHIIDEFAKGAAFKSAWGVNVNGAFHNVDFETPKRIVSLDVADESIKYMTMPDFKDKNGHLHMAHVFDGCLAISCKYPDSRTEIWVMKEYGVKDSWSMLLSVQPNDPCDFVKPVVYSKSRAEVLLNCDSKKLVWYDLRKKTVRDFHDCGLPKGFNRPVVCVGSLVSVSCSRKMDEKTKKKNQVEEQMEERKVKQKRR